jgi:dihydroorotate dehydrogenase (NAD+) catalytic subunit
VHAVNFTKSTYIKEAVVDLSSLSIGNAAGFIKGPGRLFDDMLRSAATDITIGSITLEYREGNIGETYYVDNDSWTSINSLGLPNPGLRAAVEFAPDMAKRAKDASKNLRWSFAGFTPKEYSVGYNALSPFGDVELNLGCPNVWGRGMQKPIASQRPKLIERIIWHILRNSKTPGVPQFDVKVSPYFPELLQEVTEILKGYGVRKIVACNTYANGIIMKDGKRVITSNEKGYGGIAGSALHPIMLGNVAQMAEILKGSDTKIIGVGGVSSAAEVVNTVEVGASGVQIGTAYDQRGAGIFSEIFEEMARPLSGDDTILSLT